MIRYCESQITNKILFQNIIPNILPIMFCEWPVTLVECKIISKTYHKLRNSFVPACLSYIKESRIKSPRKKILLC